MEDNLPGTFNMEPIKSDDQVIQDAGDLPENSEGDDMDFDEHAGPGKLALSRKYFTGNKSFKVPPNMKRTNESDSEYQARVRKWLIQISDHEFTQLSHLIDQENENEEEFAKLYFEAQAKRADNKKGNKNAGPCGCTLF